MGLAARHCRTPSAEPGRASRSLDDVTYKMVVRDPAKSVDRRMSAEQNWIQWLGKLCLQHHQVSGGRGKKWGGKLKVLFKVVVNFFFEHFCVYLRYCQFCLVLRSSAISMNHFWHVFLTPRDKWWQGRDLKLIDRLSSVPVCCVEAGVSLPSNQLPELS